MRGGSGSVVTVVHPAVVSSMLVGVLQLLVEPSQRWMIGRCGQRSFDIIRSESFKFVVASFRRGHGSQYIKHRTFELSSCLLVQARPHGWCEGQVFSNAEEYS